MLHFKIRKKPVKFIFLALMALMMIIGFRIQSQTQSQTHPTAENITPVSTPKPEETLKMVTPISSQKQTETYRIAIDPGHGGSDPGATGISGAYEKEFNLSLAQLVYDLLEADPMFEPILTRSDDQYVELNERAATANEWKADVMVSIHANTYTDPTANGTETIYRKEDSVELAQTMQKHLTEGLGLRDRGVKQERMHVLSTAKMPAVLIEVGYLTNAAEDQILMSSEGQKLAANAIVNGLKEFFTKNQDVPVD